jgi:hypothetical protein
VRRRPGPDRPPAEREGPDPSRPSHRPDGQPLCISNWIKWLEKREGFDNQGRPSGTPLAVKTIRNLHALLSEILQSAVDGDDQLLGRNPCAKTKLAKVQREEQVYLEELQFRALLVAMDAYFRPLLVFLVMTGVRWGEAAGAAGQARPPRPRAGPALRRGAHRLAPAARRRDAPGRVKSLCSQRIITLPPERRRGPASAACR